MVTPALAQRQRQRLRLISRTRRGLLPLVPGEGVSVLDGIFGDGTVVVCSAAPLQRDVLLGFVHHPHSTWGAGRTWSEGNEEKRLQSQEASCSLSAALHFSSICTDALDADEKQPVGAVTVASACL